MLWQRYLIKELWAPFCFALVVLGALMTTGFVLFGLIEESARFHYSPWLMLQIVLLRLPEMLYYTLPMATLLGSLLAVARLSGDQELLSLRLAGLSFWQFVLPFVLASLALSALTIVLNETLVPPSTWLARQMLHQARSGEALLPRQEHLLYRDIGPQGLRHLVYARHSNGVDLQEVVVQMFRAGELQAVMQAQSGRFVKGHWLFRQGQIIQLGGPSDSSTGGSSERILRLRFDSYELNLPASLQSLLSEARQPQEMKLGQLAQHIQALNHAGQDTRALKVRWQQKLAVPLAAVPFALLGCVLGARTLRNRSQGIGLSLLLIFVYYLLMSIGTALGDGGWLSPWLGAWLPHLFLLPILLGLVHWRNQRA